MKHGRFSDKQIVRILRETDQDSVAEAAKRHGVSQSTIYAWRRWFGQLDTDEVIWEIDADKCCARIHDRSRCNTPRGVA